MRDDGAQAGRGVGGEDHLLVPVEPVEERPPLRVLVGHDRTLPTGCSGLGAPRRGPERVSPDDRGGDGTD